MFIKYIDVQHTVCSIYDTNNAFNDKFDIDRAVGEVLTSMVSVYIFYFLWRII